MGSDEAATGNTEQALQPIGPCDEWVIIAITVTRSLRFLAHRLPSATDSCATSTHCKVAVAGPTAFNPIAACE